MKSLTEFFAGLRPEHRHKWIVRATIWPFPEGYGVWCGGCTTLLDTGLTKETAERIAAGLNENGGREPA